MPVLPRVEVVSSNYLHDVGNGGLAPGKPDSSQVGSNIEQNRDPEECKLRGTGMNAQVAVKVKEGTYRWTLEHEDTKRCLLDMNA